MRLWLLFLIGCFLFGMTRKKLDAPSWLLLIGVTITLAVVYFVVERLVY